MEIKFTIEKSQRKALAQAIAQHIGQEAEYLRVPTCAYQIGGYHLDKEAVLTCENEDEKEVSSLLAFLRSEGFSYEEPADRLTITMPKDFFTEQALANLRQIVENKSSLFRHAFKTDSLNIEENEKAVEFPWFTVEAEGDSDAYIEFISALCEFAKERKRVNNKPDTGDNEKYAFRCFLLRIGMIGTEYKQARKVLLRNLEGSSAFRHGRGGAENDAVSK